SVVSPATPRSSARCAHSTCRRPGSPLIAFGRPIPIFITSPYRDSRIPAANLPATAVGGATPPGLGDRRISLLRSGPQGVDLLVCGRRGGWAALFGTLLAEVAAAGTRQPRGGPHGRPRGPQGPPPPRPAAPPE